MVSVGILVPVYNEADLLPELLTKVDTLVEKLYEEGIDEVQVTIKEGNSTDGTLELLKAKIRDKPYYTLFSGPDRGKWSALKIAMRSNSADIFVVQDGDLEYEPLQIIDVLRPIIKNECDVCFGSRFTNQSYSEAMKFVFYVGNKLMSLIASLLTRHKVTDINTCYKSWKSVLTPIINGNGFTGDIELAIKLMLNPNVRYTEVPISYYPRAEGKKLKASDGFKLWYTLFKQLLLRRSD